MQSYSFFSAEPSHADPVTLKAASSFSCVLGKLNYTKIFINRFIQAGNSDQKITDRNFLLFWIQQPKTDRSIWLISSVWNEGGQLTSRSSSSRSQQSSAKLNVSQTFLTAQIILVTFTLSSSLFQRSCHHLFIYLFIDEGLTWLIDPNILGWKSNVCFSPSHTFNLKHSFNHFLLLFLFENSNLKASCFDLQTTEAKNSRTFFLTLLRHDNGLIYLVVFKLHLDNRNNRSSLRIWSVK